MPVCRVDGCTVAAKSQKMCDTHYSRVRRGWPESRLPEPVRASRTSWRHSETADRCLVRGCRRPPEVANLCGAHYRRKRNGVPLNSWAMSRPISGEDSFCEVPECGGVHYAKGFCNMHYARLHRGKGTKKEMLKPAQRRRDKDGNLVPTALEMTCKLDGCEEPVHRNRACRLHGGRIRRGMSEDDPRMWDEPFHVQRTKGQEN